AAIPGVLMGGIFPNRWTPSGDPSARPELVEGRPSFGSDAALALRQTQGERAEIPPLIPLGQFRDTFIIAIDDEGVVIIDQHVAHERVLYERVMEKLTAGRLESQRLLVPMTIDLSPSAIQALASRGAELERFGFELEPFGATTVKVTAVPALLKAEDCSKALAALGEDLEGLDRGAPVQ